jgi:hypothetical protein
MVAGFEEESAQVVVLSHDRWNAYWSEGYDLVMAPLHHLDHHQENHTNQSLPLLNYLDVDVAVPGGIFDHERLKDLLFLAQGFQELDLM